MFTQKITTIELLKDMNESVDRITDQIKTLRSENKRLTQENSKLKKELEQLKKLNKSKLDNFWNYEFDHSDDWRKVYEMGQL